MMLSKIKALFSKKPKQYSSPLQIVSDSFYHGKYSECIRASELLFDDNNQELSWNAKRFFGLANYRLKRFEIASKVFEEIANYSNNTDDWFNLMTASIRNNQIDLGEDAYEKFNHKDVVIGDNRMLTYSNVTYQMMIAFQDIKEYQKALEKLIVLKRYICQVKEHNSNFLGKHGIPFIYQTLVSAKETLEEVYTKEQINRFLEDFEKQVDKDGLESIGEFRKEANYNEA